MSVRSAGTTLPRHWWRLVGLGLVMTSLTAGCGSDAASDTRTPSQPATGAGTALQIHQHYVRAQDGARAQVGGS
jgi:hypothetical protein